MTDTDRAPGVQVLGAAVLLQDAALRSAANLLAWALRDHRQRGLRLPPDAAEIVAATLTAARNQQVRRRDVAPAPIGAGWLSTAETAKRLNISPRQTQRLARSLEAQRYRGQWRYPVATVNEYQLLKAQT